MTECERCMNGYTCQGCLADYLSLAFEAGVMAGAHKLASDMMLQKENGMLSVAIPERYYESVLNPYG